MSRSLSKEFGKILSIPNASTKFTPSAAEGSRLLPSRNKDNAHQIRIDAGRYDPKTKMLNVVVQVGSKAKSPGFKEYIKKNSTHGKLATGQFDTAAQDKDAELRKLCADLEAKGKQNLG